MVIAFVPFKKTPPEVAALTVILLVPIFNVLFRYVLFASTTSSPDFALLMAVCIAATELTLMVAALALKPEEIKNESDKKNMVNIRILKTCVKLYFMLIYD